MHTVMHLNLRVDPTQYISQIREVPDYDYIHMVRQPSYMVDLSLLNEKVHYLNEIFSPKKYVKRNNITLLHAHHGQLGMLLLPFKDETNLPLVTSIRGRDGTLANQPIGYLDNMKMLFEQGDRFFPVCQYLADRLIAWGCPPEKIRVLYGGVDLNQFNYRTPHKEGSQNILSVGRLVEKKGHHILMQAFQKIKGKFPNATLTIIGRGELEEQINSLANQLNLGDSFRLLNHIPKDQVREQMTNADIFCAASLMAADGDIEGIPNTLKEAMAIGVPVISTYHAGIPELITNNKEGVLVQENNVDELAEALEFMLSNRELWETYTIAARQKIEQNFNLVQQLQQQAEFYDELVAPYKKVEQDSATSRKKYKKYKKDKKTLNHTEQPQKQAKYDGELVVLRKKDKKALNNTEQSQQAKYDGEPIVLSKKDKKVKKAQKVKKALNYFQQLQQQAKDNDEPVAFLFKDKKAQKAQKVLNYIQQLQQQAKDEQLGG
ncbi:colanic acid biosynthesis glycosyltransferase WcaL [Peribacillus butanolivorans]|uniref:Colanic acid biosynthesis glycosyltransferase WcaL n=1 Tax=Peribacillus butanolivorans TaxID=421767 RepID=A0AAX0S0B8_9BACI|nr:glycosyltransferase [Peribacillus butanolivorans]PEJ27634.1 colanic acid biosynthesis glycosyltransferase WcaL [Peribacillus butanolivorans]